MSFLNIFWQKIFWKNIIFFSFQYLENDPLNGLKLIVDINLLKEIFKKKHFIQHICTILIFQYVAKASFSCLQTINVTFLILHHFPRCGSPDVSPRCNTPGVSRRRLRPARWRRSAVSFLSFHQRARARWRNPTARPTRCIRMGAEAAETHRGCYNGVTHRENHNEESDAKWEIGSTSCMLF